MPFFDDLSAWLQRNFAGGNPAGAARTLISQAMQPLAPGTTPMTAIVAAQPGVRPLNPGEQPTPLDPTPMAKSGGGKGNAFTPAWATQAGLNMVADGAPAALAPSLPASPVHAPEPTPGLVAMTFPDQPAQLTEQQRRLLRSPPGFFGGGN